jgi:excisionase family DNA binding protein
MDDRLEKMAFSVDEAAMRAGLGRDRIYAAIRDGELIAKKFGRRTLITADALRRFLEGLPSLRLPPAGEPKTAA